MNDNNWWWCDSEILVLTLVCSLWCSGDSDVTEKPVDPIKVYSERYAVVPNDNVSVLSTVFIVFITGV